MNTKPRPSVAEQIARSEMRFCRHFNGTMNDKCKIDIPYESVMLTDAPTGKRLPCYREGPDNCSERAFLTEEEALKIGRESEASGHRMIAGVAAVIEKVGKQRRVQGTVQCPSCKTGEIHYSVASSNGHIWGKCSTPGCCSWMQ